MNDVKVETPIEPLDLDRLGFHFAIEQNASRTPALLEEARKLVNERPAIVGNHHVVDDAGGV